MLGTVPSTFTCHKSQLSELCTMTTYLISEVIPKGRGLFGKLSELPQPEDGNAGIQSQV